tara:strand:- start:3153 stop:6650 length:3498 start_codon:yes stop_codon:yes gene_type:complete
MENGFNVLRDIQAAQGVQPTPEVSFMETVSASLAYKYDPLISFVNERSKFPTVPEDGYRARDYIPEDLTPYASTLLRATNQEHMDYLIRQVRDGIKTRQTLASSGIIAQFGAELFDPINYVGIPFARGASFAGNVIRGGASTATVVAGQEAIRYPLDPLATPEEAAINVGSAFVIGGAISGLVSIPVQRRIAAQKSAEEEITNLQRQIAPEGEEPRGDIAPSLFTDSWLYKAVTTPMKRILTDDTIPNSVKLRTLKIANDSGLLLAANKQGQKVGNSVYQNAKLLEGEWVRVYDETMNIWGQSTGKGVTQALDYTFQRKDFETWLEGVDSKAMRGIEPADDLEAQAMMKINKFYEKWEERLSEQGLIGTTPYYERFVVDRERRVEAAQKRLEKARNIDYRMKLEEQIRRYGSQIDEAKQILEDLKYSGPVLPLNEKVFRPRYWDQDAIRANINGFRDILFEWYSNNPSVIRKNKDGKFARVELSTTRKDIAKRVDETVASILGIKDILDPEIGYYGAGKSKHFKHRLVDIPNELVLDYIQTNPIAVMKAYTQRTGARYEFARMFNGNTIDDVLDDTFNEMMDAGKSPEKAYAAMKDMRHLYKRVIGGLQRDPDSWEQSTARILRNLAQLNYLGSAGISTITEPAKIMMEHGLGPTFRGLFSIMKNNQLKLAAKEARYAGEALDNLMNSAHLRLVDDVNNNPFRSDILDRAKEPFYLLNGLGPLTRIFKDFDAMVRSHSLIDYSIKWTQGKATKQEQEYLLRYNIDLEDAQKIANAPWQKSEAGFYMANTDAWTNAIEFPATRAEVISGPTESFARDGRYKPAFYRDKEKKIYIDEEYIKDVMYEQRGWENPRVEGIKPIKKGIINTPDDYVTFIKMHEIMHSLNRPKDMGFDVRKKADKVAYENAINDLAIAEIEKQARVSPDTVQTFRNALSSGIMNTILMGTPADKPIITDGIVYIPMRVARQFGMKEDVEFKGYARVESGLLGLPFQFYSYSLAAVNKITAAYGHGQLKNQWIGTAMSMGLGYMVLQYKTPDFVEMEFQDQFARAFDYSGVAALYSDMFYTAMSTSLALGGPNITGGVLQPRFPQKPDALDAATGLLGAGPSIATDIGRGVYDLTTGNIGEGTKEIIRNLPFARMWFWKGKMNELTNMIEGELDSPLGFGRY